MTDSSAERDGDMNLRKWTIVPVMLASAILATLRIMGHKEEWFQAVAHLWVGALIGAYFVARSWEEAMGNALQQNLIDFEVCDENKPLYGFLVIALSAIEVACFFYYRGHI